MGVKPNNMDTSENSHQSLLKSTGIFGFAQVVKVVLGVISTKCVAVFIGPVGLGIYGLLNNTLSIIGSVTGFGLNTVSVREISLAATSEDDSLLSHKISLLEKWAVLVGIFGAVISVVLSPWLSELTFGTTNKYYWFVILAVNFCITSLTVVRVALLQGKRMLRQLALSNVVTSFWVTVTMIPVYYFFRLNGIVPVILLSGIIGLLVNLYYTKSIKIIRKKTTFRDDIANARPIMRMGFLLSLNVIFGYLCTLGIKLYLNQSGAASHVLGMYEAGTTLVISYMGLVFNAMGTDFYPRLTAIHEDDEKVSKLVNHQTEVALLIITPAVLFLYFAAPFIIPVLFSKSFSDVVLFLQFALVALILKAIIWPMGFLILAKGNTKQYFKQELAGDAMNIIFSILFYHFYGLVGLGLAMVLNYLIYGFYVGRMVQKNYNFQYSKSCLNLLLKSLFWGSVASISVLVFEGWISYLLTFTGFVIVSVLYWNELKKRIDIPAILTKIKSKIGRS